MKFKKITSEDLRGKGVYGLPDTPELSKENMQAKFDELSKDVIIPAFNQMVDDVTTAFGGVYTKEQVKEYVADIMVEAGAGDMARAVYDTDGDGTVDNAKKLDGHEADYFISKNGDFLNGPLTANADQGNDICVRNMRFYTSDGTGVEEFVHTVKCYDK